MNRSMLVAALLAAVTLAACDKQPTVVTVPATPVVVPGPAGAQGPTGEPGKEGKAGDGTTLIVVPPAASAASN